MCPRVRRDSHLSRLPLGRFRERSEVRQSSQDTTVRNPLSQTQVYPKTSREATVGAARLKKGALLALGRRGSVTSRPKRSGEWADGVGRWCRRWGEPRVVALESVGVAQRRTGRAARSQAIRDRRRERTASGTVRANWQVYRSTPYVPTHRAFAHPPAPAAHCSAPAPPCQPSARTPKMGPAPAASPRWAPVTPAQPSELSMLGSGCAGGEELAPRTLEPSNRCHAFVPSSAAGLCNSEQRQRRHWRRRSGDGGNGDGDSSGGSSGAGGSGDGGSGGSDSGDGDSG